MPCSSMRNGYSFVPWVDPRAVHTYWKYCLYVDGTIIRGGAPGMAAMLKERGIASAPRRVG